MRDADAFWYSLVALAPSPENEECAFVGLVVGNGKPGALHFEPGLPRLAGMSGQSDRKVFQAVLETASVAIAHGEEWEAWRVKLMPQFRVTRPRPLAVKPDSHVVDALCRRYLKSPRASSERVSVELGQQLDLLLDPVVDPMVEIQRKVRLSAIYPEVPPDVFSKVRHRVDRVLRSPGRDLVIEGLEISPAAKPQTIAYKALIASRTFLTLRDLKGTIQERHGREIRTLGVLLNGVSNKPDALREVEDTVFDQWKGEADAAVRLGHGLTSAELNSALSWVSSTA